jgi:hypothetical protein
MLLKHRTRTSVEIYKARRREIYYPEEKEGV